MGSYPGQVFEATRGPSPAAPRAMQAWQRVNRVIECLSSKPKPQDGFAVMKRYAELFFYGPNGEESGPNVRIAPGGSGRKRNLNDVAAFLVFAVERCGAPTRFMPPAKDRIQELIGIPSTREPNKHPTEAGAIQQSLLDALLEDGRDLRLAVGLGQAWVCGLQSWPLTVENKVSHTALQRSNAIQHRISQLPRAPTAGRCRWRSRVETVRVPIASGAVPVA